MYCKWSKRLFDIVIGMTMLILLFPFMLLVYFLVLMFIGYPVFFVQKRPGLHEKSFKLYKFRTMLNVNDKNGCLLKDEQRLTTFGKILRSLSIDELPELFNVVKGEMSLVGPRPLLMEYLPCYSPTERLRHHVRPGITGWAQVNGRNTLSWEDKFELDVWYVKNYSFILDVKIMLMTMIKIIKREGINASGQATMSRFDESRKNRVC